MSVQERVVIRSSWLATFANAAPLLIGFAVLQVWGPSLADAVTVFAVIAGLTAGGRYLNYVELTPEGLGMHWFRMERLPWQRIGSVDASGSYLGYELKIYDSALNISRRLPAPRGACGVGKAETAAARELIETWWLAHGGTQHPAPARSATPRDAAGGPVDPWVPPPA